MTRKLALAVAAALLACPPALAGADRHRQEQRARAQTLAVIGDTPYGDEQIARFPADIAEINADPDVRRVIHLGDIKNGSSRCDDAYFRARLTDFQTFEQPLVYTPGDNEWTDCHRASNGSYVPTERLAKIRELFFAAPGETLGMDEADVREQSAAYPENVLWRSGKVVFGTVHVVGSNNGHAAWFGDRTDPSTGAPLSETPTETALRVSEYVGREAAALEWIDAIFDIAERSRAPAVLIGMQADMWDGPTPPPLDPNLTAFEPIKAVIAARAARLRSPVLLLQGDSHTLTVDTPVGMPPNFVRVVVQGSTNMPHEWLRLRIDASSPKVFSCENVVFASAVVTPCPHALAP